MTARGLALQALLRVEQGAYANLALPGLLASSGLARRDRALVTELVYGTTRRRRSCDWLVDRHLRGPVRPGVRAALRLGAYQLAFLRTPAHAAVSATVAEAPERARGLVNAVLRRVSESLPPAWPDAATALSYPDWIVERLCCDLGRQAALCALEEMNRGAGAAMRPDGYVQDAASGQVASLVGATPGQVVADVCSAPGGKATAMASGNGEASGPYSPGPALVAALDVRPARAAMVRDNASRLANLSVLAADARMPPLRQGSADRVLVDAPCSGLGALRRRPDARWRARLAETSSLAALQRSLLEAATGLLAPGGGLTYSVCTLTSEETRHVDSWMALHHPELAALPRPGPPWVAWGRGAILLPQAAGTDGMFVLRLTRAH